MSTFSAEDVHRLSRLARLELTADETARFAQQLTAILAYADQIEHGLEQLARLAAPADDGREARALLVTLLFACFTTAYAASMMPADAAAPAPRMTVGEAAPSPAIIFNPVG